MNDLPQQESCCYLASEGVQVCIPLYLSEKNAEKQDGILHVSKLNTDTGTQEDILLMSASLQKNIYIYIYIYTQLFAKILSP